MSDTPKNVSYKDTLNLPRTDFPIRPNHKEDDPKLLARWQTENLYHTTYVQNEGREKFIFMDGPPYANGPIHLGHAYNKVLKDIATKSRRMAGMHVPAIPGWDCHGLPIELKVTQEHQHATRLELKKACRNYALHWIDNQRIDFKRLGVIMNWEQPYTTMDFGYEADTIRVFGALVDKGYVERKNKTVPWCYSCQTVLATAEIEYQDRKDPSIYVKFFLPEATINKLVPQLTGQSVALIVWTTTPWTLLCNRALLLHPNALYDVLKKDDEYIVVGQQGADKLSTLLGIPKEVVATFNSAQIISASLFAQNPLVDGLHVPIILDQSVQLGDGTACVNNAPGVGPEDYEIGIKNNIEVFSPIGSDGRMTAEIQPAALQGMLVDDVQIWVFKELIARNALLHKTSLKHSYPHCWRCHKGLIFRATKQWFCNLVHDDLKNRSMNEIDAILMLPETSNNRFKATLENRWEWCLSRQRVWGTPIAAVLCTACDYVYCTQELLNKVADAVGQEGIEYWEQVQLADLLPKNFSCPHCNGVTFKKETDILDVWFESGVSHTAVLKNNPEQSFPADLYLEGKDQHRAYFQSSLLLSMALYNQTCMKAIITHGFTVDASGRKMSKSLGNVVSPQQMIDEIGTDCLRLWTTSIDLSGEAVVSETLIKNIQEVYRKIRNTCRFLLSNLYDFDITKDAVPFEQLRFIDQHALQQLYQTHQALMQNYTDYDFTALFHTLADYCAVHLSASYLDIIKDRLYVEQPNGHARRSAQTVCWFILDALTRAMAPVLSFTAELISDQYQKNKTASIHTQSFADLTALATFFVQKNVFIPTEHQDSVAVTNSYNNQWLLLNKVRDAVLKALEGLREQQIIKHSLEARVILYCDPKADWISDWNNISNRVQITEQFEQFLAEFFIVSQVIVSKQKDDVVQQAALSGLFVHAQHAQGNKCPRCWQWQVTVHPDHLCYRCETVVIKR